MGMFDIFKKKDRTLMQREDSYEVVKPRNIKDFHKGKYANIGIIYFPLFDKEIDINIDFDVSLEYAEKCVDHLEKLKDITIDNFCEGAINYCESRREFFEEFGIEISPDIKGRDILKYIIPQVMIIEKPKHDDVPAFHMSCSCEWEEEHGLEWTVLNDEVLYVGEFSDERPWEDREYFRTASWNYIKIK